MGGRTPSGVVGVQENPKAEYLECTWRQFMFG